MTGEKSIFSSYSPTTNSNETIIFGDNSKGGVIGLGKCRGINAYTLMG